MQYPGPAQTSKQIIKQRLLGLNVTSGFQPLSEIERWPTNLDIRSKEGPVHVLDYSLHFSLIGPLTQSRINVCQ